MKKIYIVGSINMDLVIESPYMPENGETITGCNFLENPGGKGANQAVAVSKLGSNAYMVGKVGKAFGRELKETLVSYGVNIDYVKEEEKVSSGIAVIVVVDHDNRIILDKGSNALVDKELIDNALKDANAGDFVVCQLEIPQESVKYAFEVAKSKGLTTVLNPAPAANLIDGILVNTDYFIPNQTETETYTGILPDNMDKAKEACKKLISLGVKNAIITLGTKGSIAYSNGEFVFANAYKVDAVDTTAAGDTYIGALTAKLSEGSSLKDAMDYASKASSITVTRRGAQQSIPYKNEIK